MNKIIEVKGLIRNYQTLAGVLEVLKGVDLEIFEGEIVGLIGPSGSGKSSLLHSVGLLEKIQGGEITLNGQKIASLNERQRTILRRNFIGFIYQFHNLLPELNALENVALACLINGESTISANNRAKDLLENLGLGERLEHRPAQLSGGEQQRVAIARALANRPRIILADEPTGNLDPQTSKQVFETFVNLAKKEGVCALVGTHNLALANNMDRVLRLEMGHLIS